MAIILDQRQRLGAHRLAPAEQLLRIYFMPPRHLRPVHARCEALHHDRELVQARPLPPPLLPRNHLDPARPSQLGVIAMVKHKIKSSPRRKEGDDRSGRPEERGDGAALTEWLREFI